MLLHSDADNVCHFRYGGMSYILIPNTWWSGISTGHVSLKLTMRVRFDKTCSHIQRPSWIHFHLSILHIPCETGRPLGLTTLRPPKDPGGLSSASVTACFFFRVYPSTSRKIFKLSMRPMRPFGQSPNGRFVRRNEFPFNTITLTITITSSSTFICSFYRPCPPPMSHAQNVKLGHQKWHSVCTGTVSTFVILQNPFWQHSFHNVRIHCVSNRTS